MNTGDGRQVRARFGMLLADPYRKLAAVALAVGLWFFVNARVERTSAPLTMVLAAVPAQHAKPNVHQVSVELPTDQVVGRRFLDGDRVVHSVRVRLTGPRYKIDSLEKTPALELQVKSLLRSEWTTLTDHEFTVADFDLDQPGLEGVRVSMEPARVKLEVEKIEPYEQPLSSALVELRVDDENLRKRLRLDTATFSPTKAVIRGPDSSIQLFRESRSAGTKLFKATFKSAANERQLTTLLELNVPAPGLWLAERPSMTLQVSPVTKLFDLEVQLRIDDLALPAEYQGRYQPVPEAMTRRVRINAGGQLLSLLTDLRASTEPNKLADWAREHLRLIVWIPPPEPGTAPAPELLVEATLALQGSLRLRVERDECTLDEPVSITLRRTP